jgi:hypothetical protein
MSADNKLCVIIPVHNPQLLDNEKLSLQACKVHLSNFDCFLLYPDSMDISAYTNICQNLLLKPLPAQWLASIEAYNRMKVSLDFYHLFSEYTHMLTYELDAYIFNNDLKAANAFKFDFIGAPFFEGYWEATPNAPFIAGCNSGFSVRNIASCIQVLQSMQKFRFRWVLHQLFLSRFKPLKDAINRWTKNNYDVFISGKFGFYFGGFHLNEDLIWTEVVPQLFPSFSIAPPMAALQFSFEYNLPQSLKLNGGKLPLGCHAWHRNPEFWDAYISAENLKSQAS